MRKIKIDKLTFPDKSSSRLKEKLYSVYINNSIEYFASEKKAKAFLAEANRNLNAWLLELNEIYTSTLMQYRMIVFSLKDNKITVLIIGIEKSFNLAVSRSNYTNGNHFTFKHLENVTEMIIRILGMLRNANYDKKYFPAVSSIIILIKRTQDIQQAIMNYNK